MTRSVYLSLSLALFLISPAQAQPPAFDAKAVDQFVADYVKEKHFVGLSFAVLRAGQVVLAKGYGQSALQDGGPVETGTRFAIGSVTKQFVCACILLLAEDGKLAVQDKVAK